MNFWKKLILATIINLFWISWVLAASVDHFNVTLSPKAAKVWEALDLTIEAVDKNNTTVTDYTWMILVFSESDPWAELPIVLEENTYLFKATDQWKIVFENAVKFFEEWEQNINIYDFNDDTIFGIWEANITKDEWAEKIWIEILSPENWLTIWVNKIKISWTTEKNHQVKIILNSKQDFTSTSNNEWVFEKDLTNLVAWDNIIIAKVLNADWDIVWESKEVKVKVEKSNLSLINVKVNPEEVDSEWQFEIEVTTTPKLREVNAVINDVISKLKETKDWVYTEKLFAPKDEGTYKIDIILKNDLWNEEKELWAASIKVRKVVLESAEVTENTDNNSDKKDLKITWLKLVELKTKSILTWDKLEDAKSYNVYKKFDNWELELIENVVEPKFEVEIVWEEIKYEYFAVKALAETGSWEIYEWDLSEATKIKTGPEMLILLIISIFITWLYLVSKQKRA